MKFEKDQHGIIRVAKNDKSGKGGQFAETVKPNLPNVDIFSLNFDDEAPSNLSYENYLNYDPFEETFTKNLKTVAAFGAHQPFTKAHEALADFGMKLARQKKHDFIQFTTVAFGKTKKHVIPPELKTKLIEESLGTPPVMVQGPYQMFETLALKGYSETILLLGEDRETASNVFMKASTEYGVSLEIMVVPRPANSVSGTITREAAKRNNYAAFEQLIATRASAETKKQIFDIIK